MNYNMLLQTMSVIYILRIILIALYLFLLRDSLEHLRGSNIKNKLIGYGHTFLPSVLLWNTNSQLGTNLELFILYLGTFLILFGVLCLKHNFSILPFQKNGVITDGIYSLIRHPIYLGHLLVFFVSVISLDIFIKIALLALYCFVTKIRIDLEESFLLANQDYKTFMNKVPYKLIPLIY